MSIRPTANTNPAAWGLPAPGARVHPDRVVVPKKVPDATTPTKFARFLRDVNQTPYAMGTQARGLSQDAVTYHPCVSNPTTGSSPSKSDRPSVGEPTSMDADPRQVTQIITTQQQIQPATGRALDMYL